MSAQARLVRSILIGPGDPNHHTELYAANLALLAGTRGVLDAEDREILGVVERLYMQYGSVPTIGAVRLDLDARGRYDAIDRLEGPVGLSKPAVRAEFHLLLDETVELRRGRREREIAGRAEVIRMHGVRIDPRPADSVDRAFAGQHLRGVEAARKWEAAAREALDRDLPPRSEQWPEPTPLEGTVDRESLPRVPLESLPPVLRAVVEHLAVEAQVDHAMVLPYALACLAACTQRVHHVQVRDGWTEPLGLFVAVIGEPAERKSAVVRRLSTAVLDWEAQQMETAKANLREHEAELAELKSRVKSTKGQALVELTTQISEQEESKPVPPRVVVGNVTQEEMVRIAAQQRGSIAMLSAEGAGPVAVAGGRYAGQGGTSFDVLLSGHAGDAIRVDRISREPDRIDRPAFTVGITCQLEVLRQLASIPGARGTGLLARFFYAFPRSFVGRRDVRAPSMPATVVQAWDDCLRRILDASRGLTARAPLKFNAEALEVLLRFAEKLEPRLGPGGDLRPVGDWAGKLVGAVARVAGLVAVMDAEFLPAKTVEAAHVAAAIELAPWLEAQARAAYAAGVADEALGHAVEVLEHLRAIREPISARDLQRALKGRSWLRRAADLETPLRRLAEAGWIRVSQPPSTGGRKPSPLITARPEDTPRPTAATANGAWSKIQAVLETRDPATVALHAQAISFDPPGTRQHDLRCFLDLVGTAIFTTPAGVEIHGHADPDQRRLLDALIEQEPALVRDVALAMPVTLADVLASSSPH